MKKLSIILVAFLFVSCSKAVTENNEIDKSVKVSGNVVYCDELPEWSMEQCEMRPENLFEKN